MHQKLEVFLPAAVKRKEPILVLDNARPHASQTTLQKIRHWCPLPPDPSSTNYHFFQALDAYIGQSVQTNVDQVKYAYQQVIESCVLGF